MTTKGPQGRQQSVEVDPMLSACMAKFSHTKHLRNVLKGEREARGWGYAEVGRRVAEQLGEPVARSGQSIKYWEDLRSMPTIDAFAAWARIFGMRLVVDIVGETDSRVPTLLTPEVADIARRLEALPDHHRRLVVSMLATLEMEPKG